METYNYAKVSGVLGGMELTEDQQKLVNSARELFKRIGIRSVSMDDIARELGVSKKTLYQLVDNKEQLVRMVMAEQTCGDLKVLDQHRDEALDAIDELLRNSRYFIRSMRSISPTAVHDLQKYYPDIFHSRVKDHHQVFLDRVKDNLNRGIAEGIYRSDIDAEVIAQLFVGTTAMVMDRSVFPAHERPLSLILHQHSTYHFNGIVNEAGYERVKTYLQQEDLS
ncbi:TetR family transcriptional regulator [Neolewinella xylanilytica]|uniref:TetR family transcriptional regulator n=1 Tax=Neolewinella xylanilytica TaxID=1514080 RepID=A0A2S6I3D1_9BACT|nr:TetR/AcrR family transcriptional regulator [Neolewinella xylanilytica]PPK85581.1 TetR family transcriptional regulator [Neolewinella xylanilytica]